MGAPSTTAKWVQLSLDLHGEEALAMDIYYVCRTCGPARTRIRWDSEGELMSAIGESLCACACMALDKIAFAE